MATKSVTLSAAEAVELQEQLLLGLASYAEIQRCRDWNPHVLKDLPEEVLEVIKPALPVGQSGADEAMADLIGAVQILTFKLRDAIAAEGVGA